MKYHLIIIMSLKHGPIEVIPCSKDITDIPKQYIHKQKSYSRCSPIRNKQNLLRARGKVNGSFSGDTNHSKIITRFSVADEYFNKIIGLHNENKENIRSRFFTARKQRILSELPDQFSSFGRSERRSTFKSDEQAEIIKDYKLLQSKIHLLTKSKLPRSFIALTLKHKYKKKL